MKKLLFVALLGVVFLPSSVFAQANPHIVICSPIVYSDGTTTVLGADMTFTAYIETRPAEVITETTVGCGVYDGGLFAEASAFPTNWAVDDVMIVEINGSGSNYTQAESEMFSITLNSDNPQNAAGNGPSGEFILPIELSSFSAEPGAGRVLLTWVTTTETDNAGFNILRATELDGEYTKINEQLIPGAGTSTEEQVYTYEDEDLSGGLYFYQLEAVGGNGSTDLFGPIEVRPTPTTFALTPAYPNPMAQNTEISFQLPREANVSLRIYNMAGREVRSIESGSLEAGFYTRSWDGTDSNGRAVGNGVYFYRMDAGSFRATNKLVVLR